MTPIQFASLATFIKGQDIPAIEGTITKLWDNPKQGVGDYGPWCMHNGVISNGDLSHDIVFALEGPSDNLKGKKILIECGRGKNGKLCDLEMDEYNGKRKIKVGKKATITILDGPAPSPAPAPQERPVTHSRPSIVAANAIPVGESNVSKRIEDYFKVYQKVVEQSILTGDQIAPSDLKDIATTIYLSFKEGYVWHDPVFAQEPQKEGSWEDFMYPAVGGKPARRLGDVPQADQLRYVTWALGQKEEDLKEEQKPVWRAIKAMALAKQWDVPAPEEDEDNIPF